MAVSCSVWLGGREGCGAGGGGEDEEETEQEEGCRVDGMDTNSSV